MMMGRPGTMRISRMMKNIVAVEKSNPESLKTKQGFRQAMFGHKNPKKYRVEGNITKGTQGGSTQGRTTLG